MNVTLRYFAPLRALVGKQSEQIEAETVSDVIAYIKRAYGKDAYKAAKASLIVVNDVSIGLNKGMKTALASGDTVGFLPLCGGG